MYVSFRRKTHLSILFFLLSAGFSYSQPPGYSYAKEITIKSAKIAGTLTNFPVLVSFKDADLATVGNGGHIENANGWDIVFTLTDCSTILDEQIESYNPKNGKVLIWVKVPSLPFGSDYNFFMFYGNSSVSSNPSTTATWDANYVSIWHLDEDPSSGTYNDATANAENGTTQNMVAGDQVSGIIGGACNFDGSSKYVTMGGGPPWPKCNTKVTLSVWAYYTSTPPDNENFFTFTNAGSSSAYQLGFRNDVPVAWEWGGSPLAQGSVAPSTDDWHYYAYTYDGTNNDLYIDGSLVQTTTNAVQTGTPDQSSFGVYMNGASPGGEYFNGYLDEGRISSTNRSANWIETQYNNQSKPSKFYSESSEYDASVICSVLPIKLLYFTGQAYLGYNVLGWSTETETNNKNFTVERSADGLNWASIGTINGAINSTHVLDYSLNDNQPIAGVNYYRLKQTDMDGNFTYSKIISLTSKPLNNIKVYPNPVSRVLNITVNGNINQQSTVKIVSSTGQNMRNFETKNNQPIKVNMSSYPAGIYCIVVDDNNELYKKKVIKY